MRPCYGIRMEDEFEPRILYRGFEYFEQDRVRGMHRRKNIVTAVVSGSQDYDVTLRFKDGELTGMECTCPYASGGRHCKHMAAVCLALTGGSDAAGGGS